MGSVGDFPGLDFDEFADDFHAFPLAVLLLDIVDRALRFFRRHRPAHLGKGDVLELTHAFAGDLKALADFFKGEFVVVVEPEPQFDDFRLAWLELIDHRM